MLLTAAGDPPCTHIQHRLRFTSSFRLGNIIARALDYLLLELLPQPTPAATFSAPSVSVSLGCVAVTGGVLRSTGGRRESEPLGTLADDTVNVTVILTVNTSAKNPSCLLF